MMPGKCTQIFHLIKYPTSDGSKHVKRSSKMSSTRLMGTSQITQRITWSLSPRAMRNNGWRNSTRYASAALTNWWSLMRELLKKIANGSTITKILTNGSPTLWRRLHCWQQRVWGLQRRWTRWQVRRSRSMLQKARIKSFMTMMTIMMTIMMMMEVKRWELTSGVRITWTFHRCWQITSRIQSTHFQHMTCKISKITIFLQLRHMSTPSSASLMSNTATFSTKTALTSSPRTSLTSSRSTCTKTGSKLSRAWQRRRY